MHTYVQVYQAQTAQASNALPIYCDQTRWVACVVSIVAFVAYETSDACHDGICNMHCCGLHLPVQFVPSSCGVPAVYRFHQLSDIVYRHKKQQQQQEEDSQDGEEAQSVDMWLLQDSAMAQLMDPQLAAPAVQFLVLEVGLLDRR